MRIKDFNTVITHVCKFNTRFFRSHYTRASENLTKPHI